MWFLMPASASQPPDLREIIHSPITHFLLGIVGIVAGLATWAVSRQVVEPTFVVFGKETVAKRESKHLTVHWDGVPIESLCIARLAFWNNGTTALRSDDWPESDPLRIFATSDARILQVEPTHASRNSIRFNTEIRGSSVLLRLLGRDAIESGDGVAFKIFYSGNCQDTVLAVKGRVIGNARGVRQLRMFASSDTYWLQVFMVPFIAASLVGAVWHIAKSNQKQVIKASTASATTLVGLVLLYLLVTEWWQPAKPSWMPEGIIPVGGYGRGR